MKSLAAALRDMDTASHDTVTASLFRVVERAVRTLQGRCNILLCGGIQGCGAQAGGDDPYVSFYS